MAMKFKLYNGPTRYSSIMELNNTKQLCKVGSRSKTSNVRHFYNRSPPCHRDQEPK